MSYGQYGQISYSSPDFWRGDGVKVAKEATVWA